jgi:hypothetical protein
MTEEAFIFMHTSNIVNASTRLSINITQATSTQVSYLDPNPAPKGRVTSLVLGQRAFSINEDQENTDLNSVLEQVERVKFTFEIDGAEDIQFDTPITNRTYYGPTVSSGNPFFYFQITPFLIENFKDPPYIVDLYEYQPINITLTPYLLDITFGFSEYNATIGNAVENRRSQIRVESNRTEDTVLPTNWEAIISGSAFPATVQDSLYYDTGWIKGRYNGAETNTRNNGGILPAFSGTPFRGEVFSRDTNNAYICSSVRKQVDFIDLLHTSTTPLPTFSSSSIESNIDINEYPGGFMKASDTTLFVTPSAIREQVVQENSILIIPNPNPSIDEYELMRVKSINSPTTTELISTPTPSSSPVSYVVERGYASTATRSYTTSDFEIFILAPFDIFKFERENIQYIRLINNSKILIQGNNTVVDTDKYGNVINSFECQYVEYIVTD